MRKIFAFFALLSLTIGQPAYADTFLYMAEEGGCYWCQRWDSEIGNIYPKSAEGRTAPLVRYDLHSKELEDIKLLYAVTYTPTFLLIENKVEVARIEGYPGEDFFWGLLSEALNKAKIPLVD